MYLDQKVKVDCTDHGTQNDGKIFPALRLLYYFFFLLGWFL